ncbi:MAG: SDR family NAD(P)-dependent oxidoreductase [Acidobacteriota bacterium]|jgi:acyl transferase domain-containing protein/acyl carrier protein
MRHETDAGDRIAVVGMAGRFPGAPDLDRFWDNLAAGRESVTVFTPDELATAGVDPEVAGRPEYVPAGAVLDDPGRFDAELFDVSPGEAALIDPQQRLFLESSWAALEDAGLDPRRAPARTAVFAGAGLNRYLLDHVYPAIDLDDPAGAYRAVLSNDKDFLATRVAYKLGLEGPALTVQTACSTSLVAVALACQSLLTGDSDLAVAGGVTLRLPLGAGYLYQDEGILSPDGHCRAFDADAAGTVPGSGVGVVVLERLDDALAAGHPVRAVISGWATNNDGSAKAGYTAPRGEGQARAVAEALALAGVEPASVGYVEAHGTGTRLGDPIEVAALNRAFGSGLRKGSIALGSVKTNVGHLDAAAGVASLIKAVLALEREAIPPTLHFRSPNPEIDFDGGPFRVVTELTPWSEGVGGAPRRTGVSSFGIGGTNAHAILEEAPAGRRRSPSGGPRLIAVSAATPETLERAASRLGEALRESAAEDLADVGHTLLAGRAPLRHRRAVVAGDAAAAADLLGGEPAVEPTDEVGTSPALRIFEGTVERGGAPVAFLFPGQGSQHPGMASDLLERQPLFRREMERCAEILDPLLGGTAAADCGLLGALRRNDRDLGDEAMANTALAQPMLFAVEHSLARLWIGWGVIPEALLGHSVGELVAACLAGVLDLEEALALVAERGRLVAELPRGAMLAVPLSEEELGRRLAEDRWAGDGPAPVLAAVNAPELCVVAGATGAIEELGARLDAEGISTRRLRTSHAFHSPAVEPAVEPLRAAVERCRLSPPRIPVLSNVTGTWLTDDEAVDPGYWARHLRRPVRFGPAVAELLQEPRRVLLEVGPGDALTRLVRRNPAGRSRTVVASLPSPGPGPDAPEVPDPASLLAAAGALWTAGVAAGERFADPDLDLDPAAGPDPAPVSGDGTSRRRVRLPTYPFGGKRHWIEAGPPRAAGSGAASGRSPGAADGEVIEREPDMADWFYAAQWRRTLAPGSGEDPEAGADREPERSRWLVLVGGSGDSPVPDDPAGPAGRAGPAGTGRDGRRALGEALAEELRRGGAEASPAPLDDPDRLLDGLVEGEHGPDRALRIVHLAASAGPLDGEDPTGLLALLALVRALGRRAHARPVELTVVTDRLLDVAGEGVRTPERAALAGLVRVAPQEHPGIRCRLIDLAVGSPEPSGAQSGVHPELRPLVHELQRPAGSPVVALRGRHRFEPVYERIRLEAPPAGPDDAFPPPGHYLITGGLGRFGLAVAEQLGRSAGSYRVTLLDRVEPEGDAARRLDELRGSGEADEADGAEIEVAVSVADVTDRDATVNAVREAVERFGPLAGVVHGAGAPSGDYKMLPELTADDWHRHLAPKLEGLRSLDAALAAVATPGTGDGAPEARRPFVLCASSLAPVLGGVGLGPFAAADAVLDAAVEARDRESRAGARWLSVDWEGWEQLGTLGGGDGAMTGTTLGRQQNALMMTAEEVGEAFVRVLRAALDQRGPLAGEPRVVAATGDLPARIAQWSDVLRRRGARGAGSDGSRPAGAPELRPPEGPVQSRVAAIWEELLGVDRVGADDDFFLFGGDSLVGLQVLSKLREAFDVELPLRSFFEARTVAGVAAVIDEERGRAEAEARRMEELLAEIEDLSDDEVAAELGGEEGA